MSTRFLELCTKDQLQEFFADFNATEDSINNDVKYLKEWMRKQPHLPNIEDSVWIWLMENGVHVQRKGVGVRSGWVNRDVQRCYNIYWARRNFYLTATQTLLDFGSSDDDWLINFLLRCKNSPEKTKKMLDGYYTTRTLMPEVFQDRDPSTKQIELVFRQGAYVPLPKLTHDGYRVVVFRIFGDCKNDIPDSESVIKATQMCTDFSLKVDKFRGMIVIYDFENITMNYISMMFTILKKLLTLATKTTPCRYHKIYILNLIPAVEPIINFGKTLVKKELADRVQVWKDKPSDLINVLPKEVLPVNYGGKEKSLEELRELWYDEIKGYHDWFISDEKNKADLSKRPNDNSYNNDVTAYGVEGSFRKICLD